ncbi:hypothetical protein L596_030216 [Steinernema carpocapsae]|uniref:Uncharacterized protein n=1 Tax=Steinernema carpocapsae TaxID=34508 RepID=A0A4U5LS27_STECR|nr:hypothetical protein L596_030216 [Steinernema carpocapsae]
MGCFLTDRSLQLTPAKTPPDRDATPLIVIRTLIREWKVGKRRIGEAKSAQVALRLLVEEEDFGLATKRAAVKSLGRGEAGECEEAIDQSRQRLGRGICVQRSLGHGEGEGNV